MYRGVLGLQKFSQVKRLPGIKATACLFAVNRHEVPMGEKNGERNDQEARTYLKIA